MSCWVVYVHELLFLFSALSFFFSFFFFHVGVPSVLVSPMAGVLFPRQIQPRWNRVSFYQQVRVIIHDALRRGTFFCFELCVTCIDWLDNESVVCE